MTRRSSGQRLADILNPDQNSFGIVRLMAAAAVVVSHNYWVHSGAGFNDPFLEWTGFTLGKHAVHVFFVLSGLLVSLSLARAAGLRDYAMSRVLRVFPGLAVCVVITALIIGPAVSAYSLADYYSNGQVQSYILKTTSLVTAKERLPGVFTSNPFADEVNLSLWTIKYEVFCYIMLASLAAVGLTGTRARATFVFGGIVALATATYFVPGLIEKDGMFDSIRRFVACFSLGVLAFVNRDVIVLSFKGVLAGVVLVFVAHGTVIGVPLLLVVTAYATLFVAAQSFGALSRFTSHTDLSYGMYLWGWPVAQVIMWAWPGTGLLQLQVFSLMVAASIAFVSWHVVEHPALKFAKRVRASQSSAPLAAAT